MPRSMGHIRILLSSRVLLDLEDADKVFKEKGLGHYNDYMRGRGEYKAFYDPAVGGRRLAKGPLWDFAMAALALNKGQEKPIIEIGLTCKDEVSSALPIFRNLDVNGLGAIDYRVATAGQALGPEYHEEFETDLLLTRNEEDAQKAVDLGLAASRIYTSPEGFDYKRREGPLRIWVDGDAVAFGSSSEVRYRVEGLNIYRELEKQEFDKPIEPGPYTRILAKISQLNEQFPRGQRPMLITLLTARGGDSAARVCTIAESHGINFNGGMHFLGGAAKAKVLSAHRPDLFVDDQMAHLTESAKFCPVGQVAYATGEAMHRYQMEVKAAEEKQSAASAAFGAAANNNTPQDCGKTCEQQDCKTVHVEQKRKASGNAPR